MPDALAAAAPRAHLVRREWRAGTASAGSLPGGRFGDRLDEAVGRVLAGDDRDLESELASGVRRDRTHARDLGVAEDGRKAIFRKRPHEIDHRRGAGESDYVHAVPVEEAEQRGCRLSRANRSIDRQDLDFRTSIRKQRW